jgi:hypothetical protein
MGGINMKRILIAIAILGLTACTTFEPPFQSASVHYNRVIADTNNELILLNVIRAKEREPMYFTAVSQMRGSLTLSGTTGLSADFPEDGFTSVKSFEDSESIASRTIGKLTETAANSSRTIKPSVSATIATNPSFDYQVLDTQKFYNGIMASIPPSLLASYLRQGWRDTLLMALTVEKVEFYKVSDEGDTAPDTLIATVQNDPIGMPKQDFGYFLRCFKTAPISPPLQSERSLISAKSKIRPYTDFLISRRTATVSMKMVILRTPSTAQTALKSPSEQIVLEKIAIHSSPTLAKKKTRVLIWQKL